MAESSLTFQSEVADIRLESRTGISARWQIALHRTLFSSAAPTGTLTAVAPGGARLELTVSGVHEEDGVIWHSVDKPLTGGTEVTGRLTELPAIRLEHGTST